MGRRERSICLLSYVVTSCSAMIVTFRYWWGLRYMLGMHAEPNLDKQDNVNWTCSYPVNVDKEQLDIPKHIWQSYKTRRVPREALQWLEGWKRSNPKWHMHFCDDDQVEQLFISLGDRYLQAFKAMPLGVMKSDFWRYAVLYQYGGIYTDLDTECRKPLDEWIIKPDGPLCIVGQGTAHHWNQWTIVATAKHPLLQKVLELITSEVIDKGVKTIHKHFLHKVTGVLMWTRAIQEYLDLSENTVDYAMAQMDLWRSRHLWLLDGYWLNGGFVVHRFGHQLWAADPDYVSWIVDRRRQWG